MNTSREIARRQMLSGLGAGLLATGFGVGQASGGSQETVTLRLNNQGAAAWVLEMADESVGETGVSNPALTLTVGTRYRIENLGWGAHPLAFRDEADNPLLTQSTYGGSGSFQNDDAVNWTDEGDELAFTLTADLAAELDDYVCTVHPSMEGDLQTEMPAQSPALFAVSGLTPQSRTVEQGESVSVTATVENTGDMSGVQSVQLTAGETSRSVSVILEGGRSETVEFTLDTTELDPGEYTHTVATEDEESSGTLTVVAPPEPAQFDIVEFGPPETTVTQGETVSVDVTVQNAGEVEGTQRLALELSGVGEVDSDVVALPGGESDAVGLSLDTADLDPGAYTYTVTAEGGDTAEGALTVEMPPTLAIREVSPAEQTIAAGAEFAVEVSVENVGDSEGSRVVALEFSTLGQADSEALTLASGESASVTLTTAPDLLQPGEYSYSISTPTDESPGSLTVEAPDDENNSTDDSAGDGSGDSMDDSTGGGSDGGDNETTDDGNSTDGSGPGFGVAAGVTALGGLAAYAARKLGVDDAADP